MPRIDGLVAVVFQARAPWSGGTLLPVIDGVVALPPGLTESGPLVVHVRVDDPWVPVPIPKWPPADAAFIDAPGYAKTGTEPDQRLSAYLSGEGPFPLVTSSPLVSGRWQRGFRCSGSGYEHEMLHATAPGSFARTLLRRCWRSTPRGSRRTASRSC